MIKPKVQKCRVLQMVNGTFGFLVVVNVLTLVACCGLVNYPMTALRQRERRWASGVYV